MKSGDMVRINEKEILATANNLPNTRVSTCVIHDGEHNQYVVLSREHEDACVIRVFPIGEKMPRLVYRDALDSLARVATEDIYLEDQPAPGYGHGFEISNLMAG